MTIDLTKKTFVLGSQLDELGITNFDKFNGHDFRFRYEGVIYSGRKIKGNVEKYRILHKTKDEEDNKNL